MAETESWIVDVDASSFETAVVARSFELPVVLDFWATWCEPCKVLGPLLEQRAREGAGRFLLAKVDIDRNPELAQALRIQGIPAVIAVSQGKLVDGFEGALPAERLDEFLARIAPATRAAPGPAERARELAEADRRPEAITLLRDHLRATPDDQAARLCLADLLIDEGKAPEARLVLAKLPAEQLASAAGKALAARLEFAESAGDLAELRRRAAEAPGDFQARFELGRALVAGKDYAAGLEELLEAVRVAPPERVEEAKKAMLETFDLLGLEDPVANDYRFKLSLELFA